MVLRAVGPLTVGKPAAVVEDGAERVMLFVPHGVRWLGPAAPSGDRVEMIRAFARGERVIAVDLIPWRNHVLHLLLPGRPFSVWLFWSAGWEFLFYYVNLESPFTRSTVGFDTCDWCAATRRSRHDYAWRASVRRGALKVRLVRNNAR